LLFLLWRRRTSRCVRAVDLAANNVGLPLDVLRRSDAAPAAVLNVVIAKEAKAAVA
jgi:hypothetical protein